MTYRPPAKCVRCGKHMDQPEDCICSKCSREIDSSIHSWDDLDMQEEQWKERNENEQ